MLLRDLMSDYVRARINLARGSIQQMEVALTLYGRFLQRPPTSADLDAAKILDWMRWLGDGRAARTVNGKRGHIIVLWNYAAGLGIVPYPPKIPKRHEPRRLPVAWTLEEVERIFAACDALRGTWQGVPVALAWKLALLVFWDTAARLATILDWQSRHVDIVNRSIVAPAEILKGQPGDRIFLLHPQTVEAIAASRPHTRRMLWPFPWGRRQVWPHLRRILTAAGLPSDRQRMFHCLRRSAESYAAAGRGVEWAAAAVGHSPEVARKSYISPRIVRQPSLIDALPRPRVAF